MPKGDRLKLKADPEDGTTPIANLLLEAVAMAKLSGLQKGCLLHLWRETYGWVDNTGKRKKEVKISLKEWAEAVDSTNPRVSQTLSDLEHHHIIERRQTSAWGGYYYSLNTKVGTWDKNCINHAKLREHINAPDLSEVTQNDTIPNNITNTKKDTIIHSGNSYPKKNGTVTENVTEQLPKTEPPTLYKENIKKVKEIYNTNNKTGIIFKTFDDNFQRITEANRDVLSDYIDNYGEDNVLVALNKAIKQNKRSLAYVEGILKEKGNGTHQSGAGTGKRKYQSAEEYCNRRR